MTSPSIGLPVRGLDAIEIDPNLQSPPRITVPADVVTLNVPVSHITLRSSLVDPLGKRPTNSCLVPEPEVARSGVPSEAGSNPPYAPDPGGRVGTVIGRTVDEPVGLGGFGGALAELDAVHPVTVTAHAKASKIAPCLNDLCTMWTTRITSGGSKEVGRAI